MIKRRSSVGLLVIVSSAMSAESEVVSYQRYVGNGSLSETDDASLQESSSRTNYGTEPSFVVDNTLHEH